jgi:3-phenylpropionate/cinnamic acid dioxygenase small subunit
MTADRDELEELRRQVARLTAEQEIRTLLARIAHLADDGDIDEYLDLWLPDATWERGDGDVRSGVEERRARVLEDRAAGVQGPGTRSRHLSTTLGVELLDDDTARAFSYFLYLRDTDEHPTLALTGRYVDEFRRTASGWRIASRRIVRDLN